MIHFEISEFDSPDKKGSGKNMDKTLLSMLDEAREIAQTPFTINSGYRTKKRNKKVGGVNTSSHLKGLAVDIRCVDSRSRFLILNALKQVGLFHRIGISETFIHVDIDTDKSKDVIWMY